MFFQLDDGSVEISQGYPDQSKAELEISSGSESITVHLSPVELHNLAYEAIHLANQIRSVRRGNG